MKPKTTITNDVRRAIAACGLTRYELCQRTGTAESVLSRFMAGKTGLTTPTLDNLAPLLGLRVVAGGPVKPRPKRKTGPKPKAATREGR